MTTRPTPRPIPALRRTLAIALTTIAALTPVSVFAAKGGGGSGSGGEGGWWESAHGHHGAAACLHCRLEAMSLRRVAERTRAGHFDLATGRDLLNYPPHRSADFLHMRLEIDIPDMNTPTAAAKQTLTLQPIGNPAAEVRLDAPGLRVRAVSLKDEAAAGGARVAGFTAEDGQLVIDLDPALPLGATADLVIDYTIQDPADGLIWTPESPAWPGRAAQLHTQGQPESNRYWFPMHDFPNERLTTELIVTVPRGFLASSNGRLVSQTRRGERETFHWLQDKDHVSYLVTLVVGKFDVVDIGTRQLPMPVYAPQGLGDRVKQTYGRTGQMAEHFSALIDEPYPWDRYAQLVVHNFAAGGMENTAATTMFDTAILDATSLMDGDLDGLISHELAHQWFGDLITCKSWEHIWLNEGFATYFTNLWWEKRDGFDAYQAGVRANFASVIDADRADAPYQPAMVSKEYGHPWEVFRRAANPYPKGAAVLHMLRTRLGDEAFFRGVALYVDRHKHTAVETSDLRKALEEASGLSLQRFFDQWCLRPGVPHVKVALDWDSAASALNISLEQTQNIDHYNPAFFFDLPVWVKLRGERDWRKLTVSTDTRTAAAAFPLPSEPEMVVVDPELHVLARLTVAQPAQRWLAQLTSGPTLAARARAAETLAADAKAAGVPLTSEAADALMAAALDRRAPEALRIAAVNALESDDRLTELTRQAPAEARVRRAVVEAAGRVLARTPADSPAARDLGIFLLRAARSDRSYAVTASAVRALADAKHPDALAAAIQAAQTDSQHDQVRQAALDALAKLDRPEGLDAAIRLAAPGVNGRTRTTAARTVGALAKHDSERAADLLAHILLNDRESRAVRAAGEALAAMPHNPKARAALQTYADSARSRIARTQAAEWLTPKP